MNDKRDFQIREARPEDAIHITDIFREGIPETLLPYFILYAEGIHLFIEDSIRNRQTAVDSVYIIALSNDEVVGCAEFRMRTTQLFWNHCYVKSECRGMGIGALLLTYALNRLPTDHQLTIALDVSEDNKRPIGWYERIGFRQVSGSIWSECSLVNHPGIKPEYTIPDLNQANLVQQRYGISLFHIQTLQGSYPIGRIGSHLYRVIGHELLNDPVAVNVLIHLDGTRKLLCIHSDPLPIKARRIQINIRMEGPIETVRGKLAEWSGSRD